MAGKRSWKHWREVTRQTDTGCLEWTRSKFREGYGQITITTNGKERNLRAHRWVYEQEVGPIPDHLVVGTQKDNIADMYAKGRKVAARGTQNGRAKLDAEKVAVVRSSELSSAAISRMMGLNEATIRDCRERRTWAHLP